MSTGHSSPKPSVLRSGSIEIDLADGELRRHGIRVKLEGKPFELLATLVERRGAIITREELKARLWGDNDNADFERSLNVAMSKLRTALGETPENPRYIETVRGRGYRFIAPVTEATRSPVRENGTPLAAPESGTRRQRWTGFHITVMVGCATALTAAISYFVLKPAAQPKVLEYVQITRDGHPKQGPLMMDGLHVYYVDRIGKQSVLARVPAIGGEAESLISLEGGTVTAFSPIRPEILVGYGSEIEPPLFVVSLLSGSRRQFGELRAHSAIWSPDGDTILYSTGNALYTAKSEGSQPHKLLDLPFKPGRMSWSPDGRVLRLEAFGGELWECSSDGKELRRLALTDTGGSVDVGSWAPDGRYYFFSLRRRGRSDLWVLKQFAAKPFSLAAGQLNLSDPATSSDGKRLFALGGLERVEFVRYDSKSDGFLPYLAGVSAGGLAFSRDKSWIAYTSYPSKYLWRSRADGTDRVQLTFPPDETAMPSWSPDGRRIAFLSRPPDGRWKIYAIAASGGTPEQLVPGDDDAGNPTWSPDGRVLAYAGTPWLHRFAPHSTAIHLLDLNTRKVETLRETDGLWAPRWSPDGKFLVAETLDSRRLLTYEFSTQRWTTLAGASDGMIGYSCWSSDSKFVYYNTYSSGAGKVFRVSVRMGQPEMVVALKDLDEADILGRFFTLTPDDRPLVVRDTGISEIYSLSLQLP